MLTGDSVVIAGTTPSNPARERKYVVNRRGARAFARGIIFKNTGATNALRVFLPGQTSPITLAAGATSPLMEGTIEFFDVEAAAATTTYDAYCTVAS